MIKKIDHIAVAVKSLEPVKELFKTAFNLTPAFEEIVEEQKVRVAGFRVGESAIEFLEPLSDDSPISRFLEKRGEGLHHISLSVTGISEVLQTLKSLNLKLIDEEPKIGAEGKKIAFVHPHSLHGILVELSENG